MKKQYIKLMCSFVIMTNIFSNTVFAGNWIKDYKGYKYQDKENSFIKDKKEKIDNKEYYFDNNGYMKTGWIFIGNDWYYFDINSGAKYLGWLKDKDNWYYLDAKTDGKMLKNTVANIDGKEYSFEANGTLTKGWKYINNNWYYLDNNTGQKVSGWINENGSWYYLDPIDLALRVNTFIDINGKTYFFDKSGVMKIGMFEYLGNRYMANNDGVIRKNEIEPKEEAGNIKFNGNGKRIKFDEEGKMFYQNQSTYIHSKDGGKAWIPFRNDEDLQERKEGIDELNTDFIEFTKLKLYQKYKEINSKYSQKELSPKIKYWKKKVFNKLSDLKQDKASIENYIKEVESYSYKTTIEKLEEENQFKDRYEDYNVETSIMMLNIQIMNINRLNYEKK